MYIIFWSRLTLDIWFLNEMYTILCSGICHWRFDLYMDAHPVLSDKPKQVLVDSGLAAISVLTPCFSSLMIGYVLSEFLYRLVMLNIFLCSGDTDILRGQAPAPSPNHYFNTSVLVTFLAAFFTPLLRSRVFAAHWPTVNPWVFLGELWPSSP